MQDLAYSNVRIQSKFEHRHQQKINCHRIGHNFRCNFKYQNSLGDMYIATVFDYWPFVLRFFLPSAVLQPQLPIAHSFFRTSISNNGNDYANLVDKCTFAYAFGSQSDCVKRWWADGAGAITHHRHRWQPVAVTPFQHSLPAF